MQQRGSSGEAIATFVVGLALVVMVVMMVIEFSRFDPACMFAVTVLFRGDLS